MKAPQAMPRAGRRSDKRERALRAGIELFQEYGFRDTSMDAVAARAEISKTTLYAHFRDKAGLFSAAFAEHAALVEQSVEEIVVSTTGSTDERLIAVLGHLLRSLTSEESLGFTRVIVAENVSRPEVSRQLRGQAMPHVINSVADILSRDAAEYDYRLPDPLAQSALLIRMTVAAIQLDALCVSTFRPTGEMLDAHARWVSEIFLRSLRAPGADGERRAIAPPDGYDYPWE